MSSEKAIASGAAGRYAVALFALAEEQSSEALIEADLQTLTALLAESPEFLDLVKSPLFDSGHQQEGIELVAKSLGLHNLVQNFLGVLIVNRRLDKLAEAISAFEKLAATKRGEVTATVVSATALSDRQKSDLAAKLKAVVGRDVLFATQIDEDLLGGLVIRIGSQVVDSSIRTKLANLKTSMKGV